MGRKGLATTNLHTLASLAKMHFSKCFDLVSETSVLCGRVGPRRLMYPNCRFAHKALRPSLKLFRMDLTVVSGICVVNLDGFARFYRAK